MKKITLVISIFFFIFISTSCNSSDNIDIEAISNKVVQIIDIPNETADNLVFDNTITIEGKVFTLTWISSDSSIINEQGTIFRGFKDKIVELQLLVNYGSEQFQLDLGYIKVLGLTDQEVLQLLKEEIVNIPSTATTNINFPQSINLVGAPVILTWQSEKSDVIDNDGVISFKEFQQTTKLFVEVKSADKTYNLTWGEIIVPAQDPLEHINYVKTLVEIPSNTIIDIDLPTKIENVNIQWSSSNTSVLSNTGKWAFSLNDTEVELSALFFYKNKIVEEKYNVIVKTLPHQDRLELVYNTIELPEYVNTNIDLPVNFSYGVTGTWSSSDTNTITNNGIVTLSKEEKVITLRLTLISGGEIMNKDFTVTTQPINNDEVYLNNHMLVDRASSFQSSSFNNLILENDRVVLNANALEGSYESPTYTSNLFTSLVGSWSSLSSVNSTVELEIKVRVNDIWSSYLSYSKWGLGLENAMYSQNGGVAKMSADEIIINNSQKADAFKYRITLRRDSLVYDSPKLSLVGITINIPDYIYNVDVSDLPSFVDYDVPKLNQNIVPVIGNSICSPTSSTMLLLYKGHTFEDKEMPHRQNAELFKDFGNKIYGNWVFNTVGMSSFGENSYVKRIYSWEELQHHLATVGPVALSIKGNTGRYTTGGHLLVVRGYEITDNGTYLIVNDPNLPEVYYKYSFDVYKEVSRNVIYVIE